jgi:hypothetical protein
LTPIIKQLLSEMREQLNMRYRQRVAMGARIDSQFWLRHVEHFIAPVVERVHASAPDRSKETLLALYDVGLDLSALGHFSETGGSKRLVELWRVTLPAIAQVLSLNPKVILGSLCNAALYLDQSSHAKAETWLAMLERVGVLCESPQQLLNCGKFLAWTSGLAHLRTGAIEIAADLPASVLREPLGLPTSYSESDTKAFLARLASDPWTSPQSDTGIREVARCGNFRGLDGPFRRPPTSYVSNGSIHITDGHSHWQLHADRFGHTWHQASSANSAPSSTNIKAIPHLKNDGTLEWGEEHLVRPDLSRSTSQCFDGRTLAVTIANSFHVYLFARSA